MIRILGQPNLFYFKFITALVTIQTPIVDKDMKNNLRNETSSIFERTLVPSPIPIRAGIIIALDMISKLLLKTPLSLREAPKEIVAILPDNPIDCTSE